MSNTPAGSQRTSTREELRPPVISVSFPSSPPRSSESQFQKMKSESPAKVITLAPEVDFSDDRLRDAEGTPQQAARPGEVDPGAASDAIPVSSPVAGLGGRLDLQEQDLRG